METFCVIKDEVTGRYLGEFRGEPFFTSIDNAQRHENKAKALQELKYISDDTILEDKFLTIVGLIEF